MRKSLIAQSVAAVISGLGLVAAANAAVVGPDPTALPANVDGVNVATSLVVNTDNIGHINIIPYYSAQGKNSTLINIVNNDTRNGKAVKVRFRGASNSDDVFDFTVLMSPGDKFPFAIAKDDATGLPKVAHGDKSCVLGGTTGTGINVLSGEKFVTARLKPSLTVDEKSNETREGYVEILNMADIPQNAAAGSLFQTIKHKDVSGTWKAVCDATILSNNVGSTPTDYAQAVSRGLQVPTTGLSTNWTIIDVEETLTYTGVAVAVEARAAAAAPGLSLPGYGNIVLHAQNASTKDSANVELVNEILSADPLLRIDGRVAYANYDFPDLSTPYLNSDLAAPGILTSITAAPAQAQRLSAALSKASVSNEFITVAGLKAATDWVFSMPTRRYNVAMQYKDVPTGNASDTIRYTDFGAGLNFFDSTNTAAGSGVAGEPSWQICVTGLTLQAADDAALISANRAGPATLDAEEKPANIAAALPPFVISPNSPSTPAVLKFCGEVSVFKFNVDYTDPSATKAAVAVKSIGTKTTPLPFDAGWLRMATPGLAGTVFTASAGATTNGLPVVGSSLTKLVNSAAKAGVSGNYGQSFEHKSTRPSNQP